MKYKGERRPARKVLSKELLRQETEYIPTFFDPRTQVPWEQVEQAWEEESEDESRLISLVRLVGLHPESVRKLRADPGSQEKAKGLLVKVREEYSKTRKGRDRKKLFDMASIVLVFPELRPRLGTAVPEEDISESQRIMLSPIKEEFQRSLDEVAALSVRPQLVPARQSEIRGIFSISNLFEKKVLPALIRLIAGRDQAEFFEWRPVLIFVAHLLLIYPEKRGLILGTLEPLKDELKDYIRIEVETKGILASASLVEAASILEADEASIDARGNRHLTFGRAKVNQVRPLPDRPQV